ncbi:MAG: DUF58 domain-containing protein [Planctomycetaceae bacterium]
MRSDPEVRRVVDTYGLGLPRTPAAGRTGELLGRGTGSSLEFQEYREYLPGDDIRHVDWAAYARSDQLMVRLYREEISPRTEILLDASRSMNSGDGTKARVARQLAATFALLAGRLGARPKVLLLGDDPLDPSGDDGLARLDTLAFDGVTPITESLQPSRVRLARQSVRILISDFLFPHDPEPMIRRLAGDASALWVLQLLSRWEAEPEQSSGRRLVDIEDGSSIDLVLDRRTIASYRERLGRLQADLSRVCRRVHANLVILQADKGLPGICRDDLCSAGILRPG